MTNETLPPPVPALFPQREQRERVDDYLTRALADATERVKAGPVMPDIDMARFREALAAFDFREPKPLEPLLEWVIDCMEHGTVHMTHPRYFGLFNPAPTFPSECADRIAGCFNPQLASSGSSPVPVAIEAHVIGAIARRAGLPEGAGGHFTTSGSEANYTALVCALTRANPRFAAEGVRAFSGAPVMYTSKECQPAWHKIAHQAGIGRQSLRLVDTDGTGRMDPAKLSAMVEDDLRNGAVPVLISPTAGTTGAGMVDPLEACARIAREHGIWCHIDAAWGGAALCSDRLKGELAGIEQADSVTIDAHKWFATTMGCGMFIARDPSVLNEAFGVGADFMPSTASNIDPYLNTVQWSRRFMGLRLFLSLATAGWGGYAAHVERAVELIARIKTRLLTLGWSNANDSNLAVLCALPPPGSVSVREIVRRLLASGQAWTAVATFESSQAIRICATHGATMCNHVEELVAALEDARMPRISESKCNPISSDGRPAQD
jgi:glutamate/tyrosine decarboxylase-like PLP-dependent enzyme